MSKNRQIRIMYDSYNFSEHSGILSIKYCLSNDSHGERHWHLPGSVNLATPVILFTLGFVGNSLALFILYRIKYHPRLVVFYTLVTGLVWTDITGQVITSPVAILTYLNDVKWIGGEPLCVFHGFVMVCYGIATPLIVSAMSLERYISLKFPHFFSTQCNKANARWSIVLIWIFVLLFSTFPLFGFGEYVIQYPGTWCFLTFHAEDPIKNILAGLYASINILLIVSMVTCNIYVTVSLIRVHHLRRSESEHLMCAAGAKFGNTINDPLTQKARLGHQQKTQGAEECQMVILLCFMTVLFIMCWLPLMVVILVTIIRQQAVCDLNLLSVRLASVNQICDPWVYIIIRRSTFNGFVRFCRRVFNWTSFSFDHVHYANERHRAVAMRPIRHPLPVKLLQLHNVSMFQDQLQQWKQPGDIYNMHDKNKSLGQTRKPTSLDSIVKSKTEKSYHLYGSMPNVSAKISPSNNNYVVIPPSLKSTSGYADDSCLTELYIATSEENINKPQTTNNIKSDASLRVHTAADIHSNLINSTSNVLNNCPLTNNFNTISPNVSSLNKSSITCDDTKFRSKSLTMQGEHRSIKNQTKYPVYILKTRKHSEPSRYDSLSDTASEVFTETSGFGTLDSKVKAPRHLCNSDKPVTEKLPLDNKDRRRNKSAY